jgi:hypothetical protein
MNASMVASVQRSGLRWLLSLAGLLALGLSPGWLAGDCITMESCIAHFQILKWQLRVNHQPGGEDTKLLSNSTSTAVSVLNCCMPTGLEYHANPQHVQPHQHSLRRFTRPTRTEYKVNQSASQTINQSTHQTKPNQIKPNQTKSTRATTFTKWRKTLSSAQASQE